MLQPPTALIAVAIAVLATGTAAPQDADKAAPAIKHVMATMTVPASDAIFVAASEPPKDERQWVALRALVTAAERTFKAIGNACITQGGCHGGTD